MSCGPVIANVPHFGCCRILPPEFGRILSVAVYLHNPSGLPPGATLASILADIHSFVMGVDFQRDTAVVNSLILGQLTLPWASAPWVFTWDAFAGGVGATGLGVSGLRLARTSGTGALAAQVASLWSFRTMVEVRNSAPTI